MFVVVQVTGGESGENFQKEFDHKSGTENSRRYGSFYEQKLSSSRLIHCLITLVSTSSQNHFPNGLNRLVQN